MLIVLLRHGKRIKYDDDSMKDEYLEKCLLLDRSGEKDAARRGKELASRKIIPVAYFTSCFAHARQTGEILRDTIGGDPPAKVVDLCTLTPHFQGPRAWRGRWQGTQILEAIIQESESTGNDLRELAVTTFILHQPRLQQLLASMTSQEELSFSDIGYSEGVCLKADSLDVFLKGGAVQEGTRLR